MPRACRTETLKTTTTSQTGGSHSRRKRARYISYACNRCRTAKVRCDGKLPCTYCKPRDPISCHYDMPPLPPRWSDSEDEVNEGSAPRWTSRPLLSLIQQQNKKLDAVLDRISKSERPTSRDPADRPLASSMQKPSQTYDSLPLFRSSVSAFCCIGLMDSNIQTSRNMERQHRTSPATPSPNTAQPSYSSFSIVDGHIVEGISSDTAEGDGEPIDLEPRSKSPPPSERNTDSELWNTLGHERTLRLLDDYHNMVGMMYPIVNSENLIGSVQDARIEDLSHIEVSILELMVATALTGQGKQENNLASAIHDQIWPKIESMIWHAKINIESLTLLSLLCLYYYYANRWRLAWRFVGNVIRIILELGLNRQIVLERSSAIDLKRRRTTINAIWTVFVLEQQLSYALGLSMATQDLRLDPHFPKPIEAPYLDAMIQYARIGGQTFDSLMNERRSPCVVPGPCQEIFSFFIYRLEGWQKAVDTECKYKLDGQNFLAWNHHIRSELRLRANNLRIVIIRCLVLRDRAPEDLPPDLWTWAVEAATDTVEILANKDDTTTSDLPATCRLPVAQSNYYLIAALGILLLVIVQNSPDPAVTPFYKKYPPVTPQSYLAAQQSAAFALYLLYSGARTSRQSQALWERVRGLAGHLNFAEFLSSRKQSASMKSAEERVELPPGSQPEISHTDARKNMECLSDLNLTQVEFGADKSNMFILDGQPQPMINLVSELDLILDPFMETDGCIGAPIIHKQILDESQTQLHSTFPSLC